ncbi:hypothetical protein HPP92_023353 [Vanilla planifolia]|uniref:Uncharacterized protein n=1 Tax=Vanilla planifolia TaxID=51239 RepID=A0A835PWJ9_VANPL|nr:hypothetical protein HPP92_023650 [Vanilla planifolia]KAG0460225.1 hypothetical protein HPP92_023353 [Vanilla planifolia]
MALRPVGPPRGSQGQEAMHTRGHWASKRHSFRHENRARDIILQLLVESEMMTFSSESYAFSSPSRQPLAMPIFSTHPGVGTWQKRGRNNHDGVIEDPKISNSAGVYPPASSAVGSVPSPVAFGRNAAHP